MAEDTARYPLATRGAPTARTYGAHDPALPLALTWHTTETGSWPGYRLGRVAPHHTYKPVTRQWRWHGAPVDQRVGTMRSSLWTRTPANEKAYQVEIVAYSNRSIAAMNPGWLWVGDFTADHYRDLAEFAAWLATVTDVDVSYVTPTPVGGWTSGSASPHRLDRDTWLAFDGITAHGAVTGQAHWDTGVLDLQRISDDASTLEDDMNYRKIIDLIGPGPLEKLRRARRWDGATAYYFDGRSDRVEGANKNLVEHLIASDQVASLDTAGPHTHPEYALDTHPHVVPAQTI